MEDKMSFTYYLKNPDDKESLHYYLNHHWEYLTDVGLPKESYFNYLERLKIPNKSNERKFVFITIQDFKRRECDIEKLRTFIDRIAYMYDAGFWIIESGKQSKIEDCNFHLHILVQIKKSIKNHKQVMNAKWTALFDTDLTKKDYYLMKQWRKSKDMPEYNDWLQEKLDYFDNKKKSDHSNTFDLNLVGNFGGNI
jgi:hypothetical protein